MFEGLGITTINRKTVVKNKSKANTAYEEIRKIPPISPIPPAKQNHEGNCSKTAGDISSTGDIIPPADKISPVEAHQNHAQKSATGDKRR